MKVILLAIGCTIGFFALTGAVCYGLFVWIDWWINHTDLWAQFLSPLAFLIYALTAMVFMGFLHIVSDKQ